ncbi:hypothetical protein ACOME3_004792 [Neoechinorhynchus agilis]
MSRTLRTELCTEKCRQTCLDDYYRLSKHGKVAFSIGKCLSSCKNECIELPQRTRFELSYRVENSGYNKEKKANKSSSFKTEQTYISKDFKLKAPKTGTIESKDGSLVLGVLAEIYTLPSANHFDLNENLNPEVANEICLQVKARDQRLRTEIITNEEAKKYEPNLTVPGNNEDTEISNNIDAIHGRAGDVEFEQTTKSPGSATAKIESEPSIMNELPFPEIQTSING